MRSRRRTPMGGVQAEKQQRYLQLIAQGLNNSEACRLVGINRKTGNRWRDGRRVRNSAGALVIYPRVIIKESTPRSPRYLSEQERIQIADLLSVKVTVRGIAEELGRAPSTISREIRRNRDPDGRYRPHHAEHAARLRACKPRKRRIAVDGVLAETVQRLLAKRWSPEQVARELRVSFAGQPLRWLCKESIYQAIYDAAVAITRPARRRRRRCCPRAAIPTRSPRPALIACSQPRYDRHAQPGPSDSTITPASCGITPTASSQPNRRTGSSRRSPPAPRRTSSASRCSTPSPTANARSAPRTCTPRSRSRTTRPGPPRGR